MARFLVVTTAVEEEDRGPDEEPGDAQAACTGAVPCKDTREIAAAVRKALSEGEDWALFELAGKRYERRALVMKMDGPCLYDVVVS